MTKRNWRYYNHAAVPAGAPHDRVDLLPVENKEIWKLRGQNGEKPLLASWISDWDCGYETSWWYLIKDVPFDISELKSKQRYEIKKGERNFEVKSIDPKEYKDELLKVALSALTGWDKKYRPVIHPESFRDDIESWKDRTVFGAFHKISGEMCSYACLYDHGSYIDFSVLRSMPDKEPLAVNAAVVAGILNYYADRLGNGVYISDGSRNIRHETAFQDYLIKYFRFRRAYCILHLKYRPFVAVIVKLLYPVRNCIKGHTGIGSQVSGVLKMEEINRHSKRLG